MATHSSILAWRIPWTEEPGGLPPVCTSQRQSAAHRPLLPPKAVHAAPHCQCECRFVVGPHHSDAVLLASPAPIGRRGESWLPAGQRAGAAPLAARSWMGGDPVGAQFTRVLAAKAQSASRGLTRRRPGTYLVLRTRVQTGVSSPQGVDRCPLRPGDCSHQVEGAQTPQPSR